MSSDKDLGGSKKERFWESERFQEVLQPQCTNVRRHIYTNFNLVYSLVLLKKFLQGFLTDHDSAGDMKCEGTSFKRRREDVKEDEGSSSWSGPHPLLMEHVINTTNLYGKIY